MKISAAAICVVFCVGGGVSICSAEVQDRRVSFYEVSEESAQIVSLGWVLPPERMRWTKADGKGLAGDCGRQDAVPVVGGEGREGLRLIGGHCVAFVARRRAGYETRRIVLGR